MIIFTYKVADEEFDLTQEEHEKILKLGSEGNKLIGLRNGELGINTAFIRWWKIDEESVRLQAQNDILKLGIGDDSPSEWRKKVEEKIRQIKKDLTDKLNW